MFVKSASGPLTARVIANPIAGTGRVTASLETAVGVLAARGWTVSVRWTEGPGQAETLARAAVAEGLEVVVAAGGDGTVNEVANGVVGSSTALAVLPMGTGNVLAAQLGLVGVPTPLYRPDPVAAAEQLGQGQVILVDTGRVWPQHGPSRSFVLWAGVGFDAALAHEMEGAGRQLKRRLGPFAYGAAGARALLGARGTSALIRLDERRLRDRLLMVVVANVPLYAGAVQISRAAYFDDGLLNVELFLGESLRATIGHLGSVLLDRARSLPNQESALVRRVDVVANRALPVHVDAEPFGMTPVRCTVQPASLRLVAPPTTPPHLFAPSAGGPP